MRVLSLMNIFWSCLLFLSRSVWYVFVCNYRRERGTWCPSQLRMSAWLTDNLNFAMPFQSCIDHIEAFVCHFLFRFIHIIDCWVWRSFEALIEESLFLCLRIPFNLPSMLMNMSSLFRLITPRNLNFLQKQAFTLPYAKSFPLSVVA